MGLLKYSFILSIRAMPHLFVSKFFYELRWGSYGALAFAFSVMAFFTAPVLIIFAPLTAAFTKTAMSLTNLHSMLGFIGVARKQVHEYVVAEVIKMTMVRAAFYALAALVVAPSLVMIYGVGYLGGFFEDPLQFLIADIARLEAGQVPAFATATLLYVPLSLIIDCLLAVPMGGAAYALGPSDRVFNGFWRIGYNFWPIFTSRLAYIGFMLAFAAILIAFFIPEMSLRSLAHLAQSALAGTQPDLVAYPIAEPKFESIVSQIAMLVYIVFASYLAQPLWIATSALSFRLALEEEIARDEANRACPDALRKEQEVITQSHADLRKQRMPARWQT